jgi:hypothetical protein
MVGNAVQRLPRPSANIVFLPVAAVFVVLGLVAIAKYGWTEIHADQWRLYRIYLEKPFPADILTLENGHRPVFPALLRVVEMEWLLANQVLQLAVGALLALCTVLLLAHVARHDDSLPAACRGAAIAMAAFGIFWMGNARYLLHGNESVHGYLLTTCLAGGLLLVTGSRQGARPLLSALLLAFIATFSFGPGMATFVALGMVLAIQRRYRLLPWLAAGLAMTVTLYFLLPGGTGVRNRLAFDPVLTLTTAATWLCSAPVNMLLAFIDPKVGSYLPDLIKPVAAASSGLYERAFGSIWSNHRHVAVAGLSAIAYVTWASVDTWRHRLGSRTLLVALGLAWFAIAASIIVALARADYFVQFPEQIFATRFLPWSSLFWMAFTWIALVRGSRATAAGKPRLATVFVTLALATGLATGIGYVGWGHRVQKDIRLVATGLAVGVLPVNGGRYGETYLNEVLEGLPAVRSAGLSMFAWPESRMQGRRITWAATEAWPDPPVIEFDDVDNELPDAPAWEIRFTAPAGEGRRRLLAVDAEHRVVGLLSRFVEGDSIRFRGYVVGLDDKRGLRIASLDKDGRIRCHTNCMPAVD